LASCLLVKLLLNQSFDHKKVEELWELLVWLVGLVAEAFFQLESLFTETILGPETNKTVHIGWIVQVGDQRDDQPFWYIYLDCYRTFKE